jgi:hypothetical protein
MHDRSHRVRIAHSRVLTHLFTGPIRYNGDENRPFIEDDRFASTTRRTAQSAQAGKTAALK